MISNNNTQIELNSTPKIFGPISSQDEINQSAIKDGYKLCPKLSLINHLNRLFFSLVLLCVISMGGFISGCTALISPLPNEIIKEPGIGACEDNKDCLDGQVCYNRYCKIISSGSSAYNVNLQIIPPSNHRFKDDQIAITKQQYVGVSIDSINDKSIQVREAYSISGKVKIHDRDTLIPSRIRFIDKGSIPGQRLMWEIQTDPTSNQPGTYQHRLSYGVYTVDIYPRDLQRPPQRIPELAITKSGQIDFLMPNDDDYPKISGRIISFDSTLAAIADIQVQLISNDGRLISNTATTDINGKFSLWLATGESPAQLRIQMRTEKFLHPQVDIPFPSMVISKGQLIELGDLPIGTTKPTIKVDGTVRSQNQHGGQLIAESQIRIAGEVELGIYNQQALKGLYQIDIYSDKNGEYHVELPQGKYQFEIIPPPQSHWARALIVPLEQPFYSNRTLDLEIAPKRRIAGTVCQKGDYDGCEKKLPHAQIQAIWKSSLLQNSDIIPPNLSIMPSMLFRSEISRDNGWYEFTLDPGYYDFVYIPPSDNNKLARIIHRQIKIENVDNQTYMRPDVLLPVAHHLVGQLLGPDRFPIPKATIEMYTHSTNITENAQLLGRAITNSQGLFSLPYHRLSLNQKQNNP
jgi:hypothetical protein